MSSMRASSLSIYHSLCLYYAFYLHQVLYLHHAFFLFLRLSLFLPLLFFLQAIFPNSFSPHFTCHLIILFPRFGCRMKVRKQFRKIVILYGPLFSFRIPPGEVGRGFHEGFVADLFSLIHPGDIDMVPGPVDIDDVPGMADGFL